MIGTPHRGSQSTQDEWLDSLQGSYMNKHLFSNTLLSLGTLMLLLFVGMEFTGLRTDPLLPAVAALALGGTAILDRIGKREEFE